MEGRTVDNRCGFNVCNERAREDQISLLITRLRCGKARKMVKMSW